MLLQVFSQKEAAAFLWITFSRGLQGLLYQFHNWLQWTLFPLTNFMLHSIPLHEEAFIWSRGLVAHHSVSPWKIGFPIVYRRKIYLQHLSGSSSAPSAHFVSTSTRHKNCITINPLDEPNVITGPFLILLFFPSLSSRDLKTISDSEKVLTSLKGSTVSVWALFQGDLQEFIILSRLEEKLMGHNYHVRIDAWKGEVQKKYRLWKGEQKEPDCSTDSFSDIIILSNLLDAGRKAWTKFTNSAIRVHSWPAGSMPSPSWAWPTIQEQHSLQSRYNCSSKYLQSQLLETETSAKWRPWGPGKAVLLWFCKLHATWAVEKDLRAFMACMKGCSKSQMAACLKEGERTRLPFTSHGLVVLLALVHYPQLHHCRPELL